VHRNLCNSSNKIPHLQVQEIELEFLGMSTNAFGSPLMVQLSPHNRHVILCTLKKKSRDRWIRLSVLAPQITCGVDVDGMPRCGSTW